MQLTIFRGRAGTQYSSGAFRRTLTTADTEDVISVILKLCRSDQHSRRRRRGLSHLNG